MNLKSLIVLGVSVLVSCAKPEMELAVPKIPIEQFQFNEPATGVTHLLEIKGNEADLLVKSGECFRPTRDGDFINVELVVVNTMKEGIEMDVINGKNTTRIFIRIIEDTAEIPFSGIAIHAARVKQPWLIFKCN